MSCNKELQSPHFYALDSKGNPFSVHGKSVIENGKDYYHITDPLAFAYPNNSKGKVYGNKGLYDHDKNLLEISGNVNADLTSLNDKYKIHTNNALLNFNTKEIKGDQVVNGNGSLGKFRAQGFAIRKNNFILYGPVDMQINIKH